MYASAFLASWRFYLVRGGVLAVAGLVAATWSVVADAPLALLIAPATLLDGGAALYTGVRDRPEGPGGRFVLLDGLSGVTGAAMALTPDTSRQAALLAAVALPAVAAGASQLIGARRLAASLPGEWLPSAAATTRLVMGILLLISPPATAPGIGVLVCLVGGLGLVLVGLRARVLGRTTRTMRRGSPAEASA